MKKFILHIIVVISFFSIANTSFADEWYIEKLLDLNYWIEEYSLQLPSFNTLYFKDSNTQNMFKELDHINELLKQEIMKKYRSWEFDYYQVNGIVSSHKNFVYYSNKLFYYISLKDQWYRYKELDDAILINYRNTKSSYRKVKNLVY